MWKQVFLYEFDLRRCNAKYTKVLLLFVSFFRSRIDLPILYIYVSFVFCHLTIIVDEWMWATNGRMCFDHLLMSYIWSTRPHSIRKPNRSKYFGFVRRFGQSQCTRNGRTRVGWTVGVGSLCWWSTSTHKWQPLIPFLCESSRMWRAKRIRNKKCERRGCHEHIECT